SGGRGPPLGRSGAGSSRARAVLGPPDPGAAPGAGAARAVYRHRRAAGAGHLRPLGTAAAAAAAARCRDRASGVGGRWERKKANKALTEKENVREMVECPAAFW